MPVRSRTPSPGSAAALIAAGRIDSIVGMHTSDVRDALAAAVGRRVPYIYTPLHEGSAPDNVCCLGVTPDRQLLPALNWLSARYRLRRWYFVGNDYVWPRVSHGLAARALARQGGEAVGSDYVDFDETATDIRRFDAILGRIESRRPDAILLSLIGQDSVLFNRAYHAAGLARSILRFSCAIEENMLLAMGAAATDGVFVSAGYFAALDTPRNGAFRERYHTKFAERAPMLNDLGPVDLRGHGPARGSGNGKPPRRHRRPERCRFPGSSRLSGRSAWVRFQDRSPTGPLTRALRCIFACRQFI